MGFGKVCSQRLHSLSNLDPLPRKIVNIQTVVLLQRILNQLCTFLCIIHMLAIIMGVNTLETFIVLIRQRMKLVDREQLLKRVLHRLLLQRTSARHLEKSMQSRKVHLQPITPMSWDQRKGRNQKVWHSAAGNVVGRIVRKMGIC